MTQVFRPRAARIRFALPLVMALGLSAPAVTAQMTGFQHMVAEAVGGQAGLGAFYRERGFAGLWTGDDAASVARRNALLAAFDMADVHGLPAHRYDVGTLIAQLQAAVTLEERAAMEVALSRLFLRYAADIRTGVLDPKRLGIHSQREVAQIDGAALLARFAAAENPFAAMQALAPQSAGYARLLAAKLRLEALVAAGGWGPIVQADRLDPGNSGPAVVALRERLSAMGFLAPSYTDRYDAEITAAVRAFQAANGLAEDGIAGQGTLAALNTSAETRLQQVIVAMERERWLGDARGERHIWVNLADYSTRIFDRDVETFRTRSVVGALAEDRQTPEFSDQMDYMVVNPSWYVPRSIVVNEYLPQLRANPAAVGHIRVVDNRGRIVDRSTANFAQYTAANFPYSMVQPPSRSNALGLVKFMFPNPWNIYLHDTPSKDLFGRETRAFSHGCIRLADPFDFAYALLSAQTDDPRGVFHRALDSGNETRISLEQPVPVHLDYRTAFTTAEGGLEFRRDVYGRDAVIWRALQAEGVAAAGVQG